MGNYTPTNLSSVHEKSCWKDTNALFTVIWKGPRTRTLETVDLSRTPFFNHLCDKLKKWTAKIRGWESAGSDRK